MLKPEDNERLCRIGPGTPMGALLRRYWLPAALSEELPEPDGAPVRVRILGEDLIAFRDTHGDVGLVSAFCPHRRAPMFFGRNEECGLRCVYHGWKFDRDGTCVDMPSEPPDSAILRQAQDDRVRIEAYPTWEGGGMVWAYLGPPELRPPAPEFEVCRAPATHRTTTKILQECNWVQALEGAIDSVHSGMLHSDTIHDPRLLRNQRCEVEFDLEPYGLGGAAIHPLADPRFPEPFYARSFHYVMPIHSIRGLKYTRYGEIDPAPTISGQIYVPIDDHSCWAYSYLYSAVPEIELPQAIVQRRGLPSAENPPPKDYRSPRNIRNDYLIDRQLQKTTSYTGITGMNTQDFAVQEGMGGSGAICDRSREHLAHSDQVIIAMRRLLFEGADAVERGEAPRGLDPAVYRDVRGTDAMVPEGTTWRTVLREGLAARFA